MKQVNISVLYTHKLQKGYLIDDNNVLYISNGELNLLGVKPSIVNEIYLQETAHVCLGKVKDGSLKSIEEVIEKLNSITFIEYLLKYHDREEDIHFEKLVDQIK